MATNDSDDEMELRFGVMEPDDIDELVEAEELQIRHDCFPDSDEEVDGSEPTRTSQMLMPIRSGEASLTVGQVFFSRAEIFRVVLEHALVTGRNIKQSRYNTKKVVFMCAGGNCQWRVYCAITAGSDKWEVRKFLDKHSCVPNRECELIKVPVIARLFVDRIRKEPDKYMPLKMEAIIKADYNITVSRPQCQAARNKAVRWIEAEYDKQFERLRDYVAEILDSNPMSSVVLETLGNDERSQVFNRFYVCYEVIKRSWKDTCRPLVGVDGWFTPHFIL